MSVFFVCRLITHIRADPTDLRKFVILSVAKNLTPHRVGLQKTDFAWARTARPYVVCANFCGADESIRPYDWYAHCKNHKKYRDG
ncbi:MAG: hypothetical protein K1V97_00605 [Lachnospiraceae bacterium]